MVLYKRSTLLLIAALFTASPCLANQLAPAPHPTDYIDCDPVGGFCEDDGDVIDIYEDGGHCFTWEAPGLTGWEQCIACSYDSYNGDAQYGPYECFPLVSEES